MGFFGKIGEGVKNLGTFIKDKALPTVDPTKDNAFGKVYRTVGGIALDIVAPGAGRAFQAGLAKIGEMNKSGANKSIADFAELGSGLVGGYTSATAAVKTQGIGSKSILGKIQDVKEAVKGMKPSDIAQAVKTSVQTKLGGIGGANVETLVSNGKATFDWKSILKGLGGDLLGRVDSELTKNDEYKNTKKEVILNAVWAKITEFLKKHWYWLLLPVGLVIVYKLVFNRPKRRYRRY